MVKCNRPFDAVRVVFFYIGLPRISGDVAWELIYRKFDSPRRRPGSIYSFVDRRIEDRCWCLSLLPTFFTCLVYLVPRDYIPVRACHCKSFGTVGNICENLWTFQENAETFTVDK